MKNILITGASGQLAMEIHQEFVDVLAEYYNLSGLPAYPISPVVTEHSCISAFGVGLLPL